MNILVRIPNWIGDCIMCLPALRALKEHHPNDNITLAGKEYLSPLFKHIKEITTIITLSAATNFKTTLKSAAILKKYNFHRGILLTNSFNSALLFKLAGIRQVTGYNKDLRGIFLNQKIKFPKNPHTHHTNFYMDLVKFLTMVLAAIER